MRKKTLALILVLVMAATMLPAAVSASTDNQKTASVATTQDESGDGQGQDGQGQDGQGQDDQNKNEEQTEEQKADTIVSLSRGTKIHKKWGGTLTGITGDNSTGEVTIPYGTTKVFHIKPNKGYRISKLVVNGTEVEPQKKITLTGDGNNQSISVTFKKGHLRIMLDAGHAGHYNRGVIRSYWESIMTWKLTRQLKKELESYGIECGMTKKSLRHDPAVYNRGKKARGYDLFISIHSNWSPSRATDYPLAIVSSKYKKRLYKKAQPLGKKLVKQIRKTMKTRQRYQVWIKRQSDGRDWYGVIRGAAAVNVPAIILEHSFHSNRSKCRWLMKKSNLKKMARAEAKVIARHYGYIK